VWNLLTILALAATASGDATVMKLDGSTVAGRIQSWQDGRFVLQSDAGPIELAEAEVLSLQWSAASAPAGQPIVELTDGTVLPLAEFQIDGENGILKLAAAELQTLSLPLRQVLAARLQPLTEAALAQWNEIRGLEAAGDVLVVLRRGGQSLDYLEGVIREVTASDVAFELDGETVRVPRGKVAGLIYFRTAPATEETPRCIVTGRDGLRVPAKLARLEGANLRLVSTGGIALTWLLVEVAAADFSAGKLVFLSDLEASTQNWQPLVTLPAGAEHAIRFGRPRRDQSAIGGPLTLAFPDDEQPDGIGHVESFAKGLAVRSRTELVFRLPRGYSRFLAIAGIEPATLATGSVELTIQGDDHVLWEAPIAGHDAPREIDLDVTDVRRLRIVVDYGDNLDTGDWLNLCNARLVK